MLLQPGKRGGYKLPVASREFQFKTPLTHGFLLPYLFKLESSMWGRWDHWLRTLEGKKLLDERIPQIEWDHLASMSASTMGRKSLENALSSITTHGSWLSWGNWRNFEYLLDFMLFGFGHKGTPNLPEPVEEGAAERLYQTLDLGPLLLFPSDYFGDILAQNAHGQHLGFYPTPLNVCELMARMLCDGSDWRRTREETVCDPCVGTGRMLMAASNFSYRLFAQDINPIVIKATLVNLYLYAPWGACPASFLGKMDEAYNDVRCAPLISEHLAEAATGDARAAGLTDWNDTELDIENTPRLHPIKIRRCRNHRKDPYVTPKHIQLELLDVAGGDHP